MRDITEHIDRLAATTLFDGTQFVRRSKTVGSASQREPPAVRQLLESLNQARDILATLNRADKQNQVLSRNIGWRGHVDPVRDHSNARCWHAQKLFDL